MAVPGLPDPRAGDLDRSAHPPGLAADLVRDPPSAAGHRSRDHAPGLAYAGLPGELALAGTIAAGLVVLRLWRPDWFTRLVTVPLRCRWRWWFYRRRWHAVMTISGLAPVYQGQIMLPVLGTRRAGPNADRVTVGLVSGQSPKHFADRADQLAHSFGAHTCRVRSGVPGSVVLELVRHDALAQPIPAFPIPLAAQVNLRALPVGRCEDGTVLRLRLHGTHLLIAGATGAGKGSYLWGLVRAMLPLMAAGLVRVLACDPKLMELAFGRALFDRYGAYAADPADIADLLEHAVADMHERAARFAGPQRDHTPTADDPFTVVLVDEVAFLTAYQADRKLRERTLAALATLTTQGRAVGYAVVAALQDPRKEVLNIRNLFPDKIALRLDEPGQADLVLGDGARDRGARCDEISTHPAHRSRRRLHPPGSKPRPHTRPRRVGHRRRHPRHDLRLHRRRRPGGDRRRGGRVISGWLSGEDCPDCGGPLLETSTGPRLLVLECPGCGYRITWHTTDSDDPSTPGDAGEQEAE